VFLLYGNVPCLLLTVGWTVSVAVLFVSLLVLLKCYRLAVTPQCVSFELSYAEAPSFEMCLWLIRIMSVHKLAERSGDVRVNLSLTRGWFASCGEECGYALL